MDDGSTALHCAARSGSISLVELLLEYGANVNAKTNVGTTPLHEAVINRNEATAKMLLENGAKVDATTDKSFRTDRGGGLFDLMTIFMEQNSEASREIQDATKKTALYIATDNNSLPLVKLLLSHKAHVDACTDLGATPLYVATFRGYSDILLLRMGADVNGCDKAGLKSIHIAAAKGHADIAKTLVESGCDIDDVGDGRGTPLWFALSNRHDAIVRLLCQHGADLAAEEKKLNITVMIGPKQIFYGIRQ
ncbi:ankyrin [Trematosphaeria pertusa]|uniref:Ankyrin n=1 Tax=Trematosphaeria pertusa TaxID=390896 RepID=A0A6A6IA84_9PLEO|nr:ankyrin [Trematosphaeria pertusa]KAF2247306.1 ankyrin [Trematosphaeria pertusa]